MMKKKRKTKAEVSRAMLERLRKVKSVRAKSFLEEWRPVPGHSRYEVSDRGRLRFAESKRPIRRHLDDNGYRRVNIDGKSRSVHRIVLCAFVGPCPEGLECRHLNGRRTDNRLKNLRWGTHVENMADAKRHGMLGLRPIRERMGPKPVCRAKGCYAHIPHGTKLCVKHHPK